MPLISINPATEEIIKEHAELTEAELNQKLQVAHDTFRNWRETSFAHRAERMKRLAELLRGNARRYGELMALEMGKPIKQGVAEAEKCAWVCEFYAAEAEKFLAPEHIKTDAGESFARFDPIGVVGIIAPWNYPFAIPVMSMIMTLIVGNTVVLKPSEKSPLTGIKIGELFAEAGFPEGVVSVITGDRATGACLSRSKLAKLLFTGSVEGGIKVTQQAAENLTPVSLELGGKDPAVVLPDAPVDWTARISSANFVVWRVPTASVARSTNPPPGV